MWKGYHFIAMEGIWKGYLLCQKWYIKGYGFGPRGGASLYKTWLTVCQWWAKSRWRGAVLRDYPFKVMQFPIQTVYTPSPICEIWERFLLTMHKLEPTWKQSKNFIKIHCKKMIVKIKLLNKYFQCTMFWHVLFHYHCQSLHVIILHNAFILYFYFVIVLLREVLGRHFRMKINNKK